MGAEGSSLEAIRYEAYGPGGVAIIVEAVTDNRNRTAADLRAALSKNGGNLGETGCVSWMFEQKGVVTVLGTINEEELLDTSVEGGAETYELVEDEDTSGAEVFTDIVGLERLSQTLRSKGYLVAEAELRWIPKNTVDVSEPDQVRSLLKLMDALEDLDDVQSITANFEMADELVPIYSQTLS